MALPISFRAAVSFTHLLWKWSARLFISGARKQFLYLAHYSKMMKSLWHSSVLIERAHFYVSDAGGKCYWKRESEESFNLLWEQQFLGGDSVKQESWKVVPLHVSKEHPTDCHQWAWNGWKWFQSPHLLLIQRITSKSFVLKAGWFFLALRRNGCNLRRQSRSITPTSF